jgi:hypothetical protein
MPTKIEIPILIVSLATLIIVILAYKKLMEVPKKETQGAKFLSSLLNDHLKEPDPCEQYCYWNKRCSGKC